MPRIRLVEQQSYEFHYKLAVRPQDVNYSGHVGNDSLVSLVGAARAYAFHCLGLSELNLGDNSTGMIMTDLTVNYRSEAFLFDELLVDTHFGEPARAAFRMFHRVRRDATVIALMESGFVAYSYPLRKIAPIPQEFLTALNRTVTQRQ